MDDTLWRTRYDNLADGSVSRWGLNIQSLEGQSRWPLMSAPVLLGFACEEGVRRNQGRLGAAQGPNALRQALAPLTCERASVMFDGGDIAVEDGDLESAQIQLGNAVEQVLKRDGWPVIIGGDHSLSWGSFLGSANHYWTPDSESEQRIDSHAAKTVRLGVLNLDAHFDLRPPDPQATSGTPFRQMAQWCEHHTVGFHYCALGVNRTANTQGLFNVATNLGVTWSYDLDTTDANRDHWIGILEPFIQGLTHLHLSICLDVFAASAAPGVSAPNPLGISPLVGVQIIQVVQALCVEYGVHWTSMDVAELCPTLDAGSVTARLGARLVHEACSARGVISVV